LKQEMAPFCYLYCYYSHFVLQAPLQNYRNCYNVENKKKIPNISSHWRRRDLLLLLLLLLIVVVVPRVSGRIDTRNVGGSCIAEICPIDTVEERMTHNLLHSTRTTSQTIFHITEKTNKTKEQRQFICQCVVTSHN
jgi:hypothetical protein